MFMNLRKAIEDTRGGTKIKFVDDYKSVPFIRFCDCNAVIFSQISQSFPFLFAKNVFLFCEIIRVDVTVRYLFQLTFESVLVLSCQSGPRSHEVTEGGRQKRNPLAKTRE